MTMDEAMALIEKEKGYILLDVRTKEEYESGHIPGAINIPLSDINDTPISSLGHHFVKIELHKKVIAELEIVLNKE